MSHDDKDKNPDLNLWIDPELEARVIAWVLGEVSDFEATELERLVEEKPELALFKNRIQASSFPADRQSFCALYRPVVSCIC